MAPRGWQWLGVAAGGVVGLLITLDFLLDGPVSSLDQGIYDRITAWQESGAPVHWWSEAVTKPLSPAYTSAMTTAVVAWWWMRGDRRLAYWGGATSLVVAAVITALKQGVKRELPPVAAGAWYGYAFPSGHTIGAAANLGLLILLAAQRRIDRKKLQGKDAHRTWVVALGAWTVLVVATGVGRILTQRHWASDVFASWGIGVALACATLLLARIPHSSKAPEAAVHEPLFAGRAT
jgi:membrane-associated phospholipid phosphatase